MTRRTGLRVEGGTVGARLIVHGELDLDTRRAFLAEASRIDAERVAIDLRGLDFIDSVGLTSLIEADRIIRERSGRPPRSWWATRARCAADRADAAAPHPGRARRLTGREPL